MGAAAGRLSDRGAVVKTWLHCCAALVLVGCHATPVGVAGCPPIPLSLTSDCGRCLPDEPAPRTNGDLAEAYMDCRQCVAELRIKAAAVRDLAGCR